MPLQPGSLLYKRYRILQVLAQGGMGAIYRATDEALGVTVAVKENLFSTEDFSRQFHREATILAGLRHAHLPRVTDHFVLPDQGQYLVMDYIEGEDLRERIASQGSLTDVEVIRIGVAISEALGYLHHRQPPILHRDVKPGNIKMTPGGQVFLVDFGLAKVQQTGQQTTIGAQSLTPGFAPPEQYGQGTDSRSDIYALAATLYNALTGKVPEDGLARAMGSAHLTPLRAYNARISTALAAAIERGLEIDPAQRYQEAEQFKEALLVASGLPAQPPSHPTYASSQATSVAPRSAPPVSQPVSRPASAAGTVVAPPSQPVIRRKTPWLVFGIGGFVLVGVLAAGGLLLSGLLQPATPSPGPTGQVPGLVSTDQTSAETARVVLATDTSLAPPVSHNTQGVEATSPPTEPPQPASPTSTPTEAPPTLTPTPAGTPTGGGQGQIAFASDRSGSVQIWVMGVDGSNPTQVTQMQDGACEPSWSPDGLRLVFVSPCAGKQEQYKGSSLFIINIDGSGLVSLATTPGGDYEPTWSPDGAQIAFVSLRDGRPHIYLYHLADNSVTLVSPAPVYDRQPAWSPDGSQLAFTTSRQGQAQIWIVQADGSSPREFSLLDLGPATMPAWSPDGNVILFARGSPLPGLVAKSIGDRIHEFPLAEAVRPVYNVKFSTDGLWLLFEGVVNGNHDIFRMTEKGTGLVPLTDQPSNDFNPVWQP